MNCFFLWYFYPKCTFTWEAKWTQTNMKFHFCWTSHFGVQSALYLCSDELRSNETQTGMDFISVNLTRMKFQTGMRYSCEQNLDFLFNVQVISSQCYFIAVILAEMKFYFGDEALCHVNTTQNKMPACVHKNIGLF